MSQYSLRFPGLDLNQLDSFKNDDNIMLDLFMGEQLAWEQHQEAAVKAHQLLAAAKLECGVVHSDLSIDDIDTIVQVVEIAHALNAEFITVKPPRYDGETPFRALLADTRGCFQDLNQISAETGVDAMLQLKPGSICPNSDAAMRVLEGLDPSQVGVVLKLEHIDSTPELKRSLDVLGPFLRVILTSDKDFEALEICKQYANGDQGPLISVAGTQLSDLDTLIK